MQTQMHGCFQEGMKGRPCKPPPGHRSIDYDFQHLDVGIPVVNRDPSICEGHVRPRDERAPAGRLLAETNQPGKQPRVDQTRTTAREGSEDGSSAGALTRTSIGKSWDLATCGCIIFGLRCRVCRPIRKRRGRRRERETRQVPHSPSGGIALKGVRVLGRKLQLSSRSFLHLGSYSMSPPSLPSSGADRTNQEHWRRESVWVDIADTDASIRIFGLRALLTKWRKKARHLMFD